MEKIKIGNRLIGQGELPYTIAEIGSNHNGDMKLAKRMIDVALDCGVDAVKFQSWSMESLIGKAEFARKTDYIDKKKHFGTLQEMVESYRLMPSQHKELADYCKTVGVQFLSSCFSNAEVDLLESLQISTFKIASMDINYIPFLEYVGSKGCTVILSTGMATLAEIETAVHVLQDTGSKYIALLHCVSVYPPKFEELNLRNIEMLRTTFDLPVGFSDHTVGTSISIAAIALGACIIEKHFTIDKNMPGWDHAISANPAEMSEIVREGKNVYAALGTSVRKVTDTELRKRMSLRRRAILTRDLKKDMVISPSDLVFKRPGNGINPNEINYVNGRRLRRSLDKDTELDWSDLV
jgi:N-acetylneuraminate synthase